MTPRVRPARASDRAALLSAHAALLDRHAEVDAAFALGGDASHALVRHLERGLADPSVRLFVAECGERFAGFCAATLEAAPPLLREHGRLAITEIWVERDARRGGVGRALVDAALAWGRERRAARVEVRVAARNAEAQAFWRAQGFGDFVDVLDRRL